MICYRDRSFCCHTECGDVNCHRFASPKIQQDAEEFGLPIAYTTFLECPKFDPESWDRMVAKR